jgi:hypothetical protein
VLYMLVAAELLVAQEKVLAVMAAAEQAACMA